MAKRTRIAIYGTGAVVLWVFAIIHPGILVILVAAAWTLLLLYALRWT